MALHRLVTPTSIATHPLVVLSSRQGRLVVEGVGREDRTLASGMVIRDGDDVFAVAAQLDDGSLALGDMVLRDPRSMQLVADILALPPCPRAVLVQGETGSGKEGVSRLVAKVVRPSGGTLEPVNCACLPLELVEAELFGAAAGAYTGAQRAREGACRRSHGGTLLLDELGELPVQVQPKLLRFLDSGECRPLGASATHHVDTTVVAATNRHLPDLVARGGFRADLYYRLAVFVLTVPPLRDRPLDIVPIARALASRRGGSGELGESARRRLERYAWPGNVRELANVITRAAHVARGGTIEAHHLAIEGEGGSDTPAPVAGRARGRRRRTHTSEELQWLQDELARSGGNIRAVSRATGVPRSTIYYHLDKGDLERVLLPAV